MKNFVLQFIAVASFAFGLYFYSRGFLLTRHALGKNNTCTESRINLGDDSNLDQFDKSRPVCWVKRRFRRAIWIVIDALRYDFTAPVSADVNEYYHNKLTVIADLLRGRPRNSLLYKFIADAPTTTLQRLKGLTTGSLPTFIDAGQNFGGSAIDEDNLIDQLVRSGRNITFLGDDTWKALFPTQFTRSFPFPSFDVKDLHTVDNGILEYIFEEIKAKDSWDVLIAHFLGVDHCGHKYGPNHPEMAAKLDQMNRVLKDVIGAMDSETVLFVLGDHGMTQSGDHGGDSSDEINSALFVYSPAELHHEDTNLRDSVSQIDIVPTMALLMDIPIPFSSLGRVLLELFPDERTRSRAVEANVLQVFRFAEMYMANFRDPLLIEHLQPIFSTFYAHEPDELTVEKSLSYISRISRVFVECWAKFHIGWMALGIVTLLETLLWLIAVLIDPSNTVTGRRLLLKLALFALSLWVVLDRQERIPPMVGILCGLLIIFHIHMIVVSFWHGTSGFNGSMPFGSVFAGFVLVADGLSQFSNSYVVYEDKLAYYFSASLLVVLVTNTARRSKPTNMKTATEKKRRQASIFRRMLQTLEEEISAKAIVYCIVALILLCSMTLFGRCREEQYPCTSSLFTLPFASLLDENIKAIRIAVAVVSLLLLYFLPRRFLSYNGHLSGDSLFCIVLGFGHFLMVMAIAIYWTLQWLPERSVTAFASTTNVYLFPPLLCYGTFVVLILAYLLCPHLTSMHSVPDNVRDPPTVAATQAAALTESEAVRHAYQHLRINWRYYLHQPNQRSGRNNDNPRWAVFGLASGYSAPLVAIVVSVIYLLALLLGDGFSYPLLTFTVVQVILLELCSEKDSLVFVALLSELASHFFYSFGHQPTFATIPWEAAFVGVPGNFRYRWVQGTMVVLRISAAHVFVAFVLPLKACWRYYWKKLGPFAVRRASTTRELDSDTTGTEAELIHRQDAFLNEVTYLNCAYIAAVGVKVLCVTLASALHRRHLMVWKVFAPKFIFDGIHFLLTCAAVMIQYVFVVRLHKAMVKRFSSAEFVRQHKLK